MRPSADSAGELGVTFFTFFDAGQRTVPPVGIRWHFQNFIWSIPMMDVVMVALGLGFFALSIAYVYACEQL
jgi:hypothetical protein